MAKKTKKPVKRKQAKKEKRDFSQIALSVVEQVTGKKLKK
jgi:hypothetical protein